MPIPAPIFVLLLSIIAGSCAASPHPSATPAIILVFGDSLTAGNMLPASDRGRLWTRQVQQNSAGRLTLINEGKGGRSTDSIADFKATLARHPETTALVIMLGTNDSRDTSAQCIPRAVANISAMIGHARATRGENFPVLLIAPPNINKAALGPTKPIANEREASIRAFVEAYQALAGKQRARFLSLHGILPPETLATDGVHPDAAGNDLMTGALLPALLSLAD